MEKNTVFKLTIMSGEKTKVEISTDEAELVRKILDLYMEDS